MTWTILGSRNDKKDPARAFDAALEKKIRAYDELKQAVAGVLYLRNKIEGEIRERRAEIARVHDQIRRAVELAEEDEALALVRHKLAMTTELARTEHDLSGVADEAEDAKAKLLEARDEIRALERERLRARTAVAGARARARVGDALLEIANRAEEELQSARDEIARIMTERTLERELNGSALADRILAASGSPASSDVDDARRELDAIKERYLLRGRRDCLSLAKRSV